MAKAASTEEVAASRDTHRRTNPLPLYLLQWKTPSTLILTAQVIISIYVTVLGIQDENEGSEFRLLELIPIIVAGVCVWLYDYEKADAPVCQRFGICKRPNRVCMLLPVTASKLIAPVSSSVLTIKYLLYCVISFIINLFGVILHSTNLNNDVHENDFVMNIYGIAEQDTRIESVCAVQRDGSTICTDQEITYYINSQAKLMWYALQFTIQFVGFVFHYFVYQRTKPADTTYEGYA
jgi:hypothetical protein